MFKDINILTWIILFFVYLAFDILYTKYILSISKLKAITASTLSVILCGFTAYGTIKYVENFWNVIPIIAASWLGTYFILKYEIRKRKRKRARKSK
jgi:TRAP-type C4-dicarboxylate transport system permease small subunit